MTEPMPGAPRDGVTAEGALDDVARSAFGMVRAAMVLLVVAFVATGAWWVDEGTVVVRLRLGEVVGEGAGAVLLPGGPRLGLPAPIDQRIVVPTTLRETDLTRSFWPDPDKASSFYLTPGEDGSLLTGDRNLVHARFSVAWHVPAAAEDGAAPALDYALNVGDALRAEELVSRCLESAVIATVSSTGIDDVLRGRLDLDDVADGVQRRLDAVRSGIRVATVSQREATPPGAVAGVFPDVTKARSQRARKIEQAERERTRQLQEIAGRSADELLAAIDRYERDRNRDGREGARAAERAVRDMFERGEVGGRAAEMLGEARTYRTRTVAIARASAERMRRIVSLPETERRILTERLLHETVQRLMSTASGSVLLPPGDGKGIWLNLDPREGVGPGGELLIRDAAQAGQLEDM